MLRKVVSVADGIIWIGHNKMATENLAVLAEIQIP